MKIGLVGPSYQEWSLPFDPQRTVNLYPVVDQQGGKGTSALYGTDGLLVFSEIGTGPIRMTFAATNGRAFAVSGSKLYEVNAAGTGTERGTLDQSSGTLSWAENGTQLAICDGQSVYIFTYSTNVLAKVTDPDLPSAGTITFIDSYFVINENNTGRFYISALLDGTSWGALDFATAESSPDNLKRVFNGIGQLWLFGEKTTEIWNNTGDAVFPFEAISGANFNTGVLSPFTMVEINKSVFWVGRDEGGIGGVYQTQGFSPVKISTPPIERLIIEAGDHENMVAFYYSNLGHTFYMITGGGLDTSLVYDLTTGLWHERAWKNDQGEFEQHLANSHMFIFNKHLVGDRIDGDLYEMSPDYYDDNGTEIIRERIYTNISDENKRIRYNKLEIDFEGGIGLQTGQGSDPTADIYISKDGGKTYSSANTVSIGKTGKYKTQAVIRRIGVAEQITFKLRISDPIKVAMTASFLS